MRNAFLLVALLLLTVSPLCADGISISLVGEVIVGQGLEPLIDREGPGVLFSGLQELLQTTDLAVATLGCSLGSAGERRPGIEHAFRAPASLARGLAHAGIQYVSLASPHIMDYGPESLTETLRLLRWYAVSPFGAGRARPEAESFLIKAFRLPELQVSLKVGMAGYFHGGQFSDAYADDITPGLVPATWSVLERRVPAIKAEVDLLLVWLHWGVVPGEAVSQRQRLFAHRLIELGADVVIGQKSHIWQGMEIFEGKPIFYSLSDLFFDTYSRQRSRTVVPQLFYEGSQLREIRLIPIWLEPEDLPYQPKRLTGEDAQATLQLYQQLSPGVEFQFGEDAATVLLGSP